jgi:hypothetical protein
MLGGSGNGKFLSKLNMNERPIVKKYRQGKMKRTLCGELKVLEIVKMIGTCLFFFSKK